MVVGSSALGAVKVYAELVEGVVNHQILGLHHVRDDLGGPWSWDLGFLAFGAVLLLGGWALCSADRRDLDRRAVGS